MKKAKVQKETNKESKKLNKDEIVSKEVELRNKIHDLRLQKFMGGEMNTALIRTTRRELARVLTALNMGKSEKVQKGANK